MDATTILMHNCYDAFYEKLNSHFLMRGIELPLMCDFNRRNKTRKYQHFEMLVDLGVESSARISGNRYAMVLECKFNLDGDMQVYIKLQIKDVFDGAGDFDSKRVMPRYYIEDIIRSFCDACPTWTLAIIKV